MEEIKAMLLQEKENLIQEILKSQEQIIEHEIGDEIDNSVEEQERKLAMLLQDRERDKLEKIEEAIKRIEEGDYGECEECGEPISEKRLMIVPFARMCINCQQEAERYSGNVLRDDGDSSIRFVDD